MLSSNDRKYNRALKLLEREKYSKAIDILEELVSHDYPEALYKLGKCYYYGNGVDQDYKTAFNYLNKSNDMLDYYCEDLLLLLATCYLKGQGVKKDNERANELYQEIVDLDITGHATRVACEKLGDEYYSRRSIGKAEHFYERVGAENFSSEESKLNYGRILLGHLYNSQRRDGKRQQNKGRFIDSKEVDARYEIKMSNIIREIEKYLISSPADLFVLYACCAYKADDRFFKKASSILNDNLDNWQIAMSYIQIVLDDYILRGRIHPLCKSNFSKAMSILSSQNKELYASICDFVNNIGKTIDFENWFQEAFSHDDKYKKVEGLNYHNEKYTISLLDSLRNSKRVAYVVSDVSKAPVAITGYPWDSSYPKSLYEAVIIHPEENPTWETSGVYTIRQFNEIKSDLECLLEGIPFNDGTNTEQVIREISRRVANRIEYDYESIEDDDEYLLSENFIKCRNLIGPALYGRGVCCGISEYARNAFAMRGIESCLFPMPTHMILQVKVGDNWYNHDITRDLDKYKNGGILTGYLTSDDGYIVSDGYEVHECPHKYPCNREILPLAENEIGHYPKSEYRVKSYNYVAPNNGSFRKKLGSE